MLNLVLHSPRDVLQRTQRITDQLMDEPMLTTPFTMLPFDPMNMMRPWGFGSKEKFFPGDNLAIDLYEEGDKLVVKASLPGVQKEDVEVMEQNGFLTIRVKNEANKQSEENKWRIRDIATLPGSELYGCQ